MLLYEKEGFLSIKKCDELIAKSNDLLEKAKTLGVEIDGYRTALNAWIPNDDTLSIEIRQLISTEVNVPVENMERLSIIKYDTGGEYKEHHDFFHPGQDYYDECMSKGGQRIKTALIYLNDGYEGGQTAFPIIGMTFQPKKGKAVFWDSSINGELYYESLHAGLPVISGTKYIAVVWMRENKFIL